MTYKPEHFGYHLDGHSLAQRPRQQIPWGKSLRTPWEKCSGHALLHKTPHPEGPVSHCWQFNFFMQESFVANIICCFVIFQAPRTSPPRGNNLKLRRKEKNSFHKAWGTLSSLSTVVSAGTNSTAWKENGLYSHNPSAPIQTWQHHNTNPKTTQKVGEAEARETWQAALFLEFNSTPPALPGKCE